MLDYISLKETAKSIRRSVKDLLALSPANDPFYAGTGARRRDAEWFADVWREHGETGSHLRRLHYRLISASAPIYKPDGAAYQNTENDWQLLSSASLSARYLDLVPFDGLIAELPAGTVRVSSHERVRAIAARRRAVLKRYQ